MAIILCKKFMSRYEEKLFKNGGHRDFWVKINHVEFEINGTILTRLIE